MHRPFNSRWSEVAEVLIQLLIFISLALYFIEITLFPAQRGFAHLIAVHYQGLGFVQWVSDYSL